MTAHPLALLLTSALGAPLTDAPAVELSYRGIVDQVSRQGGSTPTKQFELYCLLRNAPAEAREIVFLLDERGAGGWAWPERFGHIPLDAQNAATNRTRIELLHEHDGLLNPVPLLTPVFADPRKLGPDAEWKAGRETYQVVDSGKRGDRECWQIEVTTNFGRSHTVWVEKESAIIVAVEQRFFLGRGDQFRLTMELAEAKPLADAELARLDPMLKTLKQLRADLQRKEGATDPELSDDQLNVTDAALTNLTRDSEGTPFSRLVTTIARDVKSQSQRSADVQDLARKLVGSPAPEFELKTVEGTAVRRGDRTGKIIVLHFWKYHGEPLTEPYGQVGYLDFMNNRRQKLGVQIYGVAVDPRLGEQQSAEAAVRQVRKLREFMNLSYPVALDDGTLLKEFGDPQRLGARLPLWVVIDPEGKIAHYHAGYYDVKPNEGLVELDGVLAELIRKRRGEQE